jgi:transcriptional regulator with XRE-family HTH domain
MRLGTRVRAARTAQGLSTQASALICELPTRRLREIEQGKRLPIAEDLRAFAIGHGLDTPSVFLWGCEELIERLVAESCAGPGVQDDDLFELFDEMTAFLAERGRI